MRSTTVLSRSDLPAGNDGSDEDRRALELHRSERHFRHLLDKLPAGAFLCDADGLITYYNPCAVELWGCAPRLHDTVDRFCGSFKLYKVDGTPLQHDECWMALALKHKREYTGEEIVIERQDGSRIIGLAHANPIHDEAGRMIGTVNVLVDITERKDAEDALRQADRAKNEFLAVLSHELRNPLAPLRSAVDILRHKGTDEPEGLRALDLIDRQVRHLTYLVGDLLDVSRINDGRLVLRESDVSLDEIVEAAVEISRPLMDEAGHEFTLRVLPESATILGDAHRLSQALSNVLNNAACYTPRGGRIELVLERQGDGVRITVEDNGIGIPADKLESIFDVFTVGDGDPDCPGEGLGIGLAITRRVLELHGGSITAHSDGPGTGSIFTMHLPATVAMPVSRSQLRSIELPTGDSNRRVLLVDDNPDVIESMSMLLEIMNIDVRTASSGVEAIELGESYRPNVIFMDIGMPGMNGLECARVIRQKEWGKSTNLIAVTGWGQEKDIQRSLDAGFDNHLVKPMDPDALIALLQ